jgi:hypothetical protein
MDDLVDSCLSAKRIERDIALYDCIPGRFLKMVGSNYPEGRCNVHSRMTTCRGHVPYPPKIARTLISLFIKMLFLVGKYQSMWPQLQIHSCSDNNTNAQLLLHMVYFSTYYYET